MWVDTHPDLLTPAQFQHAHAMFWGNLLGNCDPDFIQAVTRPIKPDNVIGATSPLPRHMAGAALTAMYIDSGRHLRTPLLVIVLS